MKIIQCNVKDYLTKWLGLAKKEVKEVSIKKAYELERFLGEKTETIGETILSYELIDIEELLRSERNNSPLDDNEYETTYIYLFGKLWETK